MTCTVHRKPNLSVPKLAVDNRRTRPQPQRDADIQFGPRRKCQTGDDRYDGKYCFHTFNRFREAANNYYLSL
jgi:hypothetical protein